MFISASASTHVSHLVHARPLPALDAIYMYFKNQSLKYMLRSSISSACLSRVNHLPAVSLSKVLTYCVLFPFSSLESRYPTPKHCRPSINSILPLHLVRRNLKLILTLVMRRLSWLHLNTLSRCPNWLMDVVFTAIDWSGLSAHEGVILEGLADWVEKDNTPFGTVYQLLKDSCKDDDWQDAPSISLPSFLQLSQLQRSDSEMKFQTWIGASEDVAQRWLMFRFFSVQQNLCWQAKKELSAFAAC